ncbi:hypothetical protein [Phaeobacter sp. NW0010-22]|uniref:hypothetical protein n=1 Tax=Phaeobacter sp. NW0010-22 TaxID=3135907 RepID=UPI003103F344
MAQSVEDTLLVRMEASLRKFERQMEGGRKAAVRSAVGSEKAWAKAGNQISANANRAATGLGRMTQVSGRGTFVIQNTANQIGDMAVQIGGGTTAMKAMGQQFPQLLGGFGALGGTLGILGPILGTVAALGFPLAATLLNIGGAADTLDDKLKALAESVVALKSADGLASTSAIDLVRDYGDLAEEAQAVFEINREIAAFKAGGALDKAARGIAGELGVEGVFGFGPEEIRELEVSIAQVEGKLAELNASSPSQMSDQEFAGILAEIDSLESNLDKLKSVSRNVDDLAESFGITKDAAREVVAQFAAIGQAEGPREQAQAMSDLVDYIHGASGGLSEAEEEGSNLYDRLREATIKALELAKVDVASNIGAGADQAERLKAELAAALALQNRINEQGSKVYSGRGGDPRKVGTDDYTREQGYEDVDALIKRYTVKTKTRGGSGGRSSANKGLQQAQRLFDGTRTEAEKYAIELERIEELHRRFPQVVTSEVRDRAVEALSDIGSAAERLEQGFEDAFVALVTGAGSGQDAVKALMADLARMAAQSAFKGLFKGVLGGGSGGGILGDLFAGFFDDGGMIPAGKVGIAGERGPELVRGPAVVTSRVDTAKILGSGGGGVGQSQGAQVHVSVSVDESGNLVPVIQQVSGQVAARAVAVGAVQQDRKTAGNIQNYSARRG